MRQFALQFAAHNVRLIPVQVWRDGDRWRKRPHIKDWRKQASAIKAQIERWWDLWPLALVGVPLEHTGLVVVDCDRHGDGRDGVAALSAIELPPHQWVTTMSNGGQQHFFRQPEQPIHYEQFGPVQALGIGRFVVAYALAPFITPAPVLPEGLLDRLPNRPQGGPKDCCVVVTDCSDLLDALRQMNPRDWNGEHDDWRDLMNACKAEGIACEDFVAWSTGDPDYAGAGPDIRRKWKSLRAEHGGALWKALSARGIRIRRAVTHSPRVPLVAKTISVRKRTDRTCTILAAAKGSMRKEEAWNSASVMAEMVGEGRLHRRVANTLLQSALWMNGLWREDRGLCERIIGRAYAHVKSKMLWNEMS